MGKITCPPSLEPVVPAEGNVSEGFVVQGLEFKSILCFNYGAIDCMYKDSHGNV